MLRILAALRTANFKEFCLRISPENKTLTMDGEKIREWRLPDDLTRMILLRVPANDLIRYKLVCKLWLSLISLPDFASDQIKCANSHTSKSHTLLFHIDPPYITSGYSPPRSIRSVLCFVAPHMVVVGSVNGLICIVGKRSLQNEMKNDDIWILNPVTGHIMKLPLPLPSESPSDEGTVYYYDPAANCDGNAYFVFWWDGDGDGEYKLAKIVPKSDYANTTVASVWVSSSPETWSEIHVGFDGNLRRPSQYPSGCDVLVGGFAYWIVFKNRRDLLVLSLDLKTLALSLYEIPFPVHHNSLSSPDNIYVMLASRWNCGLFAANWKGEFALAERMDHDYKYHVWTMDVDQGWIEKCSFDYPVLKWIKDVSGKAVVMITVYSEETGILCGDPRECGIALYNIETGEAEVIEDFILGHLVDSAHDFVESLASIEGFKPIEDAEKFRVFWPYPSVSRTNGKFEGL